MKCQTIMLTTASRFKRTGRLLCALALAALVCFCGPHAEAKTKKSRKSSSSTKRSSSSKKRSSSSKKDSSSSGKSSSRKRGSSKSGKSEKKQAPAEDVALKTQNYPAEISGRVKAYNTKLDEVKSLRRKDPALAKAKAEVLKIEKQSFDMYDRFIGSADAKRTEKIRKAVAVNGWYKGMPQIAFVASMGLPEDVETLPSKDGTKLRLVYRKTSFFFEKGELRSVKN